MEGSLRRFMVTQRFLGLLPRENPAGFTLGTREDLWLASLMIYHLLAMREGQNWFLGVARKPVRDLDVAGSLRFILI